MYTTDLTNAKTPASWFFNLYIIYQNENWIKFNFKSWKRFLLDSSASILVPKIPTYMMMTQMFNVCNHDQQNAQNCWLLRIVQNF